MQIHHKRILYIATILFVTNAFAVSPPADLQGVKGFLAKNQKQLLTDYFTLLAIPNLASDQENILKNAKWITNALRERKLQPVLLKAPEAGVPPVVYAEWKQPGAKRTL